MKLSDRDWEEVVAQLRKWYGAIVELKRGMLYGYTVDDVIGDGLTRYFEGEGHWDACVDKFHDVLGEPVRLGVTRQISWLCRFVIIDRWRKTRGGLAKEQPYPTQAELAALLVYDPRPDYDYESLKEEIRDRAEPSDIPFIESFIRLAEGPQLNPNLQVAEDLQTPTSNVVAFKKRIQRAKA